MQLIRKRFLRDFLLVSISVTVAFLVENYRENLRDKQDSKSLMMKIIREIETTSHWHQFIVDHSRKHVIRFDSLQWDLGDCMLEDSQKLVDLHSYMAYMADLSGPASFEALKNSGLASSISNDTLLSALYVMTATNKRNLDEYRTSWKRSQQEIRILIKEALGSGLSLDRERGIVIIEEPRQKINESICAELRYSILAWQSTMLIYSTLLEDEIKHSKSLIEFLKEESLE